MEGLAFSDLEIAFDKMGIGLLILEQKDPNDINSLKILFVNETAEIMRGAFKGTKKLRDTLGKSLLEEFPSVKDSKLLQLLSNAIIHQQEFKDEINHESEYVGTVLYYFHIVPIGNSKIAIEFQNTDAIAVRNQLKISEKRFRNIVNDAPFGIVGQRSGKVVFTNPTHLRMFGYDHEDEVIGRRVGEFFRDDLFHFIQTRAENRHKGISEPTSYTTVAKRKDGALFDIQIDITQFQLDDGLIIVGFEKDISQTRKLEEALMFRQRMDSIGTLASGIVHDFNNILTSIRLNTDYIINHNKLDDDVFDSTKQIIVATERAREVIKQIQYISSQKIAEEEEEVDLYEIVSEVFGFLRNMIQKPVNFELQFPKDPVKIVGTKAHFHQIFMNLGTNSLTAVENSENAIGKVSVKVEFETRDNSKLCKIYFRDNGSGIPPQIRSKVFDPFYSTKSSASDQFAQGLGLAMVYNIITRYYNGTVELTDSLEYTEFLMQLPYSDRLRPLNDKDIQISKSIGKRKVLLIDDDEGIRFSLTKGLERLGYEVVAAESGKKGLKILSTELHRVDLVILDLIMPGMPGEEVIQGIKSLDYKGQILLVSGFKNQIPDQEKYEFLKKPFSIHQLDEKINQMVHEAEHIIEN